MEIMIQAGIQEVGGVTVQIEECRSYQLLRSWWGCSVAVLPEKLERRSKNSVIKRKFSFALAEL